MSYAVGGKKVKTRRIHRCWGCLSEIPVGTIIERETWVDGGEIFSTYICDTCLKVIDEEELHGCDDIFAEGCLKENHPQYYKPKKEGASD